MKVYVKLYVVDMVRGLLGKIIHDKKAATVAVSTVIITSAAVALGFAVLYWAQSKTDSLNSQFNEEMEADIARLREKITFECVFYDSVNNELYVYVFNCGKSDDVTIVAAYVRNDTWMESFSDIQLRFLNGTVTESLDTGEHAYIKLSVDLTTDSIYTIRLITGRGRIFETSFAA